MHSCDIRVGSAYRRSVFNIFLSLRLFSPKIDLKSNVNACQMNPGTKRQAIWSTASIPLARNFGEERFDLQTGAIIEFWRK